MQRGFFLMLAAVTMLSITAPGLSAQRAMDNRAMERILKREAEKMEGEAGSWMVYYGKHLLLILTDEANNRMRVFTPITAEEEVSAGQMRQMLQANFHSALDAKYGFYEGFAVSVFTHPLAELSEAQLVDALRQVVNLAATFGTTYSSTDLIFGDSPQPDDRRINQSPKKNR